MTDGDKRKDSRITIRGGLVNYKGSGGGLFAVFKGSSGQYPILNLSIKGLRFLTKDKLALNDKLSFNIGIPALGNKPLRADGRVAWIKRSAHYNANIVGVQFTVMNEKATRELQDLIDSLDSQPKVKQKLKVVFSERQFQEPTLWQIARDYDVTVNILNGSLTNTANWLMIEIEGEKDEVRKVVQYLKESGAE